MYDVNLVHITTYIQNHVPDDLVIADNIRVLPLCFQIAVDKVVLIFELVQVLHAVHEALYRSPGSN